MPTTSDCRDKCMLCSVSICQIAWKLRRCCPPQCWRLLIFHFHLVNLVHHHHHHPPPPHPCRLAAGCWSGSIAPRWPEVHMWLPTAATLQLLGQMTALQSVQLIWLVWEARIPGFPLASLGGKWRRSIISRPSFSCIIRAAIRSRGEIQEKFWPPDLKLMARECFWCVLGNQVYVSHIAMLYYRSSTVQHLPNLRHVLFTHHASKFNFGLTLHCTYWPSWTVKKSLVLSRSGLHLTLCKLRCQTSGRQFVPTCSGIEINIDRALEWSYECLHSIRHWFFTNALSQVTSHQCTCRVTA